MRRSPPLITLAPSRADTKTAREALAKDSASHPRLAALQADLARAEAAAGPAGRVAEWLLGTRHTFVHRARRTTTWSGDIDHTGLAGFSLQLPVFPGLTEVEAMIHAGGHLASTFTALAADMLDRLGHTVNAYAADVGRILLALWCERRDDPMLITQSPRRGKQPTGIIRPIPQFRGFPDLPAQRHDRPDRRGACSTVRAVQSGGSPRDRPGHGGVAGGVSARTRSFGVHVADVLRGCLESPIWRSVRNRLPASGMAASSD
ncbi:MAG TPA: hypothetical protein VG009_07640 [Candidatus Dormibacteraeota bacterium]|nr:hypothetical protein [Candidatus Dormibacteraeota bacterium]